ncbi:predicted protein [Naegleria gruberi]|uniref:Predicted protein n=1 Tax=Naegleria gruberi TaxID=5762 RepID=D2W4D5_NAEGR|nr:uncharacterized protein NAEGRDRAFT_76267 [Naegleria gruberi]EFC36072.1 predicted protein [Naegleria gruberi]|eukprot:XP_002668816.1 predicted protein [Naegleria gruberi strain NEG-M]
MSNNNNNSEHLTPSSSVSDSLSMFSSGANLSDLGSSCEESVMGFLRARDVDNMQKLRRGLTKETLQDHEDIFKQIIDHGFISADLRGTRKLPESSDNEFYPFQSLCNLLMNPFVILSETMRADMIKRALKLPNSSIDTPNYALKLSACVGCQTVVIDKEIKPLLRNLINIETKDSLLSNRACVAYAAVYLNKLDLETVFDLLIHPQYLVRQNIKAWIFKQLYEEVMNKSLDQWKKDVIPKLSNYIDNVESPPISMVKKDFLADLEKFRHEKTETGFSKMNQYQMLSIPNIEDLHELEEWKKRVRKSIEQLKVEGKIQVSEVETHYHICKRVLSPYDLDGDGILTENEALQLSYLITDKH